MPIMTSNTVAPIFIQSISNCFIVELEGVQTALVELEGVEPSSKQGNHTLSTCLSWPSFSCCDKTQATNHNLIL